MRDYMSLFYDVIIVRLSAFYYYGSDF